MRSTERLAGDERGVALVLALFALVVIGGMVASSFFVAWLEQQSGRNVLFAAEAAEAADGDLWHLSELSSAAALALPVDAAPLDLGTRSAGPGLVVQRQLTRLTDNLFLVESRATRQDAGGETLASRSMGLLIAFRNDSLSGGQILRPIGRRAWLQLY
jgi:hypothetical protein